MRAGSLVATTAVLTPLLGWHALRHVHASATSTSMRVYAQDGSVDFCFSGDCSAAAPSLSIWPRALLQNTTVDYIAKNVTASTLLADFTNVDPSNARWLSTPTYNSTSATYRSTLYARACWSGCDPVPSSAADYDETLSRSDAVGMKLEFVQHGNPESLPSVYESYDVPSGALTMNVSFAFAPPSAGSNTTTSMTGFAVSFLVLATDSDGVPTTNVTITPSVDGKMYLTRIHLGSEMYVDLPSYATVDGYDSMVDIAATGHTTDELQDLIEITLAFSAVQHEINYVFGIASDTLRAAMLAASTTPSPSSTYWPSSSPTTWPPSTTTPTLTPTPTPTTATPTTNSSRMMLGARGLFALCGEWDCTNGAVSMSFTGLASNSTIVKRFAHSPAFIFDTPRLDMTSTGVEIYSTQFSVSVPQSRLRPLRPATSNSSSSTTDAAFSAMVDQYLAAAQMSYADAELTVPKGAIKYSISITQWRFASMDEVLTLNMSINVQDGTNSSQSIDSLNANTTMRGDTKVLRMSATKQLELPLRAIVDGVATRIRVELYATALDTDPVTYGYTIAFTFPAFHTSLYYDPVLRADDLDAALPLDQVRKTGSWTVAIVLLVLLGLMVFVSIIRCTKKVKVKLDFTKIIP